MISPVFVQTMARYNAWQNRSLIAAADTLDDAARREDRGAFWGSIHQTLAHILWGDLIWMSRFDGWDKPKATLGESGALILDWDSYCDARSAADADICVWAERLDRSDLEGEQTWYSGAARRDVGKPKWLLITHLLNHQIHHRGQVHAMLTAAGAKPDDTDLFLLPEDA